MKSNYLKLSFLLFYFFYSMNLNAHEDIIHSHEIKKWFLQHSLEPLEAEFISFNGSSVFLKELKTNIILNYHLSEFSMEDQLLILKKQQMAEKINREFSSKKIERLVNTSFISKKYDMFLSVFLIVFSFFVFQFLSTNNKTLSIIFSFSIFSFLIIIACNSEEIMSGSNEEIVDEVSTEDSQNDTSSDSSSNNNSTSDNTSTQTSSEDDYLEVIKTYFDDFSGVTITNDEEYFYVNSYSWPEHQMGVGITSWQEQVPIPQNYTGDNSWQIPLKPELSDSPVDTSVNLFRGAIAIAINGVPIFNVLNNRGENAYEKGELDNWGGHFGRGDDYHYHMIPTHLEDIVGKNQPLAYGLDGFPVYGLTNEPLDNAFGRYDENGNYIYHASSDSPYYMPYVVGKINIINDGIEPQPSQNPIRPSDGFKPVAGATVTGFSQTGTNAFSFEYTVDGIKYYVNYNWDEDCKFTFTYVDENGGTSNLPHNGSLPDDSTQNSESFVNRKACVDVNLNSSNIGD